MSSTNNYSALDFTSASIKLSPILPSLSELLAQERFIKLIHPCYQHILKYLQRIHPLSNLLKNLYQYKDELFLIIEGIIQWFYLHFHSALIGEHFYGLKRTANYRLRSLIFSVFLPYVKRKLQVLHEDIKTNPNNYHTSFHMILQIAPKLNLFIEGLGWLYRLSYAFGLTKYYSPTLQLANVSLTYAKDPSPIILDSSLISSSSSFNFSRLLSIISQIISNGLYVIQFINWWTNSKRKSTTNLISSSSSSQSQSNLRHNRQCLLCHQLCYSPTIILGSGYVYCHTCITDYVEQYQRCPTTHRPVTNEQLIKISY